MARAAIGVGRSLLGLGMGAGTAIGVAGAIGSTDPIRHSMNASQEIAFGTTEFDNELLGRDISPMMAQGFPYPKTSAYLGAGAGGLAGGLAGGAGGWSLGKGWKSRSALGIAGMAMGTSVGGTIGAGVGLRPWLNSETVAMSNAITKNEETTQALREKDIKNGYRRLNYSGSDLPYIPAVVNEGRSGDQDNYDLYSPIPLPRRSRLSNNNATGDIVFGAYNLRMGRH